MVKFKSWMSAQTTGKIFDVGGPETLTYQDMMRKYAEYLNKNLFVIEIPFLTTTQTYKILLLFHIMILFCATSFDHQDPALIQLKQLTVCLTTHNNLDLTQCLLSNLHKI